MSICLSRLFAQGHLSISPQLTRSIDASWQKYQEIFEIFEEHMQEKYEKYFENIENIFKKYLDNFENIFRKYFRKQLPVTTFCFPQLFPPNPLLPAAVGGNMQIFLRKSLSRVSQPFLKM